MVQMTDWYAFRASREKKAALELARLGVEAVAVMRMERRRTHRHGKAKQGKFGEPIAAVKGYVFARWLGEPDFSIWRGARYVGPVVRFDGRVQPLRPFEARWLENLPNGLFWHTESPRWRAQIADMPAVVAGDVVRLEHGPWRGIDLRVQSVDGRKLRVMMQMFGAERFMSLDTQSLSVDKAPEAVQPESAHPDQTAAA